MLSSYTAGRVPERSNRRLAVSARGFAVRASARVESCEVLKTECATPHLQPAQSNLGGLGALEGMKMATIYFAIGEVAAHDGFVTARESDDGWLPENPNGWTYQDVCGAHGRVLDECDTRETAQAVLDAWLAKCSSNDGGYCYTHNPAGVR